MFRFFSPTVLTAATRRVDVALSAPSTIPTIYFVAGAAGAGNRAVDSRVEQWSVYAQDQIKLSDALTLIAGIRYDRFDNVVTNRFTGVPAARTDSLWSPRAGLVFKPADNALLYISYSRSYLPQSGDQFISLDATSAALEPERFDNYEVGAKWDIAPGLSTSIAVFRLDRTNTRAPGVVPGTVVQTGEQRSHGIEFGLVGQVTPAWQVALGYANIDGEIRETTSAAPAGRQLAQLPRHQFTLWNRYDVSDALGIGIGLFRQSAQFTSISNVTRLPGYTRVDAAIFYDISDRLSVQLNAENLFNTRYFPNAHNDNNISTGAPRSVRLTLRADF